MSRFSGFEPETSHRLTNVSSPHVANTYFVGCAASALIYRECAASSQIYLPDSARNNCTVPLANPTMNMFIPRLRISAVVAGFEE